MVISFVKRNWIGITGLLIGLIALLIAIRSDGGRDLVYSVDVGPLVVYDPEVTTAYTLEPTAGAEVWNRQDTDVRLPVWMVRITVWNAGSASIREGHILKPLSFKIGEDGNSAIEIWEIQVQAVSRPETNFTVDATSIYATKEIPHIPFSFDILEHNDGANIQVIYSSQSEIPISVTGTVEGLRESQFLPSKHVDFSDITIWGLLYVGIYAVFVAILYVRRVRRQGWRDNTIFIKWLYPIGIVAMMSILVISPIILWNEIYIFDSPPHIPRIP